MIWNRLLQRTNSFKYKLLFSNILLILAFSLITTLVWNSRTAADAEKSAKNYMNEALRVSNSNLEVALMDINQLVAMISTNHENVIEVISERSFSTEIEELKSMRKIEDYITGLCSFKYYLNGILVAGTDGKVFMNTSIFSPDEVALGSYYEKIIKAEGQKVIIPPHYPRWVSVSNQSNYKDMAMSIARSIMYNDKPVGIVMADIRCDILNNIFDINLRDSGTVFIFDSSTGKVIFTPDPQSDEKLPVSSKSMVELALRTDRNYGSFYFDTDLGETLAVYRYSESTKWTTVGLIPKSKLMEKYNRTRDTLIFLTVLFCIVAVVVSVLISAMLTRNLFRLNRAMKQIDKDNLDIAVNIKAGDEIGQLYRQFNAMVSRIRELVNEVKTGEREKTKAEIRVLQAQINPHFLYNTLNTIKFLSSFQGADNIEKVAVSLTELLHINMDGRFFIRLEEEMEYIRNYLILQEYKYSNKFVYMFSVEHGLEECMVPKLLLQPVVENALVHGIAPMSGQGVITIKAYNEANSLKIRIQDNGIGMNDAAISLVLQGSGNEGGIGLRNVLSRIRLNFGEPYGLNILSQKDIYTVVELTLPIISSSEVNRYV